MRGERNEKALKGLIHWTKTSKFIEKRKLKIGKPRNGFIHGTKT